MAQVNSFLSNTIVSCVAAVGLKYAGESNHVFIAGLTYPLVLAIGDAMATRNKSATDPKAAQANPINFRTLLWKAVWVAIPGAGIAALTIKFPRTLKVAPRSNLILAVVTFLANLVIHRMQVPQMEAPPKKQDETGAGAKGSERVVAGRGRPKDRGVSGGRSRSLTPPPGARLHKDPGVASFGPGSIARGKRDDGTVRDPFALYLGQPQPGQEDQSAKASSSSSPQIALQPSLPSPSASLPSSSSSLTPPLPQPSVTGPDQAGSNASGKESSSSSTSLLSAVSPSASQPFPNTTNLSAQPSRSQASSNISSSRSFAAVAASNPPNSGAAIGQGNVRALRAKWFQQPPQSASRVLPERDKRGQGNKSQAITERAATLGKTLPGQALGGGSQADSLGNMRVKIDENKSKDQVAFSSSSSESAASGSTSETSSSDSVEKSEPVRKATIKQKRSKPKERRKWQAEPSSGSQSQAEKDPENN